MSVLKPFFDIERFETRTKKYVHFKTDGVSVKVLLGEECELKPKARKTKRKRKEEDDEPAVSSASYDVRVGLDPGLHYLFVAKNNTNAEDNTSSAKMSLKEYYHESKFNWNTSKQKKCYARSLITTSIHNISRFPQIPPSRYGMSTLHVVTK